MGVFSGLSLITSSSVNKILKEWFSDNEINIEDIAKFKLKFRKSKTAKKIYMPYFRYEKVYCHIPIKLSGLFDCEDYLYPNDQRDIYNIWNCLYPERVVHIVRYIPYVWKYRDNTVCFLKDTLKLNQLDCIELFWANTPINIKYDKADTEWAHSLRDQIIPNHPNVSMEVI